MKYKYDFTVGSQAMRNGNTATILTREHDANGVEYLVGFYRRGDNADIMPATWRANGRVLSDETDHPHDLIPPIRSMWLNIYSDPKRTTAWHTRQMADVFADPDRTACILTIYFEGEGL